MAFLPGYQTQRATGGTPYVDLSASAVPVQWRLYERHTNSLTIAARDIVDDARTAHWSFADVQLGDGAAVRWLNRRQRSLLLMFRAELKGLVTVTVRTKRVLESPGNRVGVTPRGVPYVLETAGDGYAVYLTESDQVPYMDTAGVPIASDPVSDGWPLPVEVVSLMAMKSIWTDGRMLPVTVTTEDERSVIKPGRQLVAFASGSRIAPVRRPGAANGFQSWESVVSAELSYIPLARITALCCLLTLPTVLSEALTAGLMEYFANQSKSCDASERARFAGDARRAEAQLQAAASEILGEVPTRSIIFKG